MMYMKAAYAYCFRRMGSGLSPFEVMRRVPPMLKTILHSVIPRKFVMLGEVIRSGGLFGGESVRSILPMASEKDVKYSN